MHDFFCTDPDDMHFKPLADKVRYLKENEKGVMSMCKVLEEMRKETARITEENTKDRIAMSMIKDGTLSLEQIARFSELALEKVKELAESKPVEA